MPGPVKTEAVVLRSIRYGEADRILHLYTPHRGRVGAIAKGVRRARSRFGGRLEPFFRLDLVLHEGRSDLLTVTGAETVAGYRAPARATARALDAAARACDAVGAPVRDRRAASRGLQPALQRARAARRRPGARRRTPTSSPSASSCCSPPASRRSSAACASCGEREHLSRLLAAPPAAWCARPARRGAFPLDEEAHAFLVDALGRPLAETPAGAATRALRQAERAIAETVEHHAASACAAASRRVGSPAVAADDAVGLRLRGGLARHARPARRQGRERRGDDARPRAPSACPPGSRSRPRRASPTCATAASPDGLDEQVDEALARARGAGRQDGSATPTTRCWSRCARGARESMPGMLDTVLNLGLNDESVAGPGRARPSNERFAWDSYRRFVQMFGNVVRGIEGERFEDEIKRVKARPRRQARHRARRRRAAGAHRGVQGASTTFPTGPARAARAGDPRGLRLLEGRARGRLPAHQPHPRRLGHRGQRPADGLRQQGRHVGLGRGVQPRRGDRRARAQRRLPRQRPGRGRRLAACATRSTSPSCATACPRPTRS